MNLKSRTNDELLKTLKRQVEDERKLLMEILYSLREVEDRKLHLEMGYPDLYTFAMEELGYSSGAAYRRISAMRLLKSLPDVSSKLETGALGLENASQAQSYFRKEDQRREKKGEQKLSVEEKREVVSELFGKSTREGQRVLMEKSPEVMTPVEKIRPLADQKSLVQFVADAELMSKLDELKHLLAHQSFEGRMEVLIKKLADIALKVLRPKASTRLKDKMDSDRPCDVMDNDVHRSEPSTPALGMSGMKRSKEGGEKRPRQRVVRSRYIPAGVKRSVLARDQDGCTYKDPKTGRVCHSRHGLQFDHIMPYSQGGAHSVENLALRCGAHNRYRAEKMGLCRSRAQVASEARVRPELKLGTH